MSPAQKVVNLLCEFSIPLILGVVIAVIWANVDEHSLHALVHYSPLGANSHLNLHFLTNDILMAIFFGLAAKEITEACLPGGALNPLRAVVNPIFATLGGVIGPAAVFFGWVWWTGDTTIANGWGIPTATDIAVGWLIARLIFGAGHPAVQFLVLVAVLDDGIGLGIIAVFYPDPAHPVEPALLGMVAAAAAMAYGMRRFGVKSFWPYLLGPGLLSWSGLFAAHLHPALALVPIVPFMPGPSRDDGLYIEVGEHLPHPDTLNRFEHSFKVPVDFALFAFGLANAGVAFTAMGNATAGVLLGLIVGKTVGVLGFGLFACAIGFPLPKGLDVRSLAVVGVISGAGLTVALFLAGAAYTDSAMQGAAKMGALGSVIVAPMAMLLARVLGIRKAKAPSPESPQSDLQQAPA